MLVKDNFKKFVLFAHNPLNCREILIKLIANHFSLCCVFLTIFPHILWTFEVNL